MERDKQRKRHRQETVRDFNAEREPLKNTEAALISGLISNSRRSDRELAKATGVSQRTVSRMIKKLEKEGIVIEYTMIPD